VISEYPAEILLPTVEVVWSVLQPSSTCFNLFLAGYTSFSLLNVSVTSSSTTPVSPCSSRCSRTFSSPVRSLDSIPVRYCSVRPERHRLQSLLSLPPSTQPRIQVATVDCTRVTRCSVKYLRTEATTTCARDIVASNWPSYERRQPDDLLCIIGHDEASVP